MKNTVSLENKLVAIETFTSDLPELKNIKVSKAQAIGEWLCQKIVEFTESGKISVGQKIPSKADFAYRLGVSIGTIQNALKFVEDNGLIEAKPCVGTLIRDKNSPLTLSKKNISKRDVITSKIKDYIVKNGFKKGDDISSSKHIAQILNEPSNTVRSALENLCNQGILTHKFRKSGEKAGWYLEKDLIKTEEVSLHSETLVEQTVKNIEKYITEKYKIGDRIKTHTDFAKMFNTSVSTIHSAFQVLIEKGILITRRGQYGTCVLKMPSDKETLSMPKETSIFAPAADAQVYYYEKLQTQIKKIISENYSIGDKLPPIVNIADDMDISANTVRKALLMLAQQGYVRSERGRYGGTFVTDIPDTSNQSFKWLAVNPKFVKTMK